ncbi:MAG: beta-ketoacyl-[acyl-carrier-protein] synthase family protein [Opitutaceae bacterium]|nr:beta-ketoacyl-[acyl-carrier-protein] synthase family protein [Opitutaceae bacterium]
MSDDRRVAVTGLGLVTAIGHTVPAVWASLLAGRSGIRALTQPELATNTVLAGATIDPGALDPLLPPALRRADRAVKFAAETARQALTEARCLPGSAERPQEIAVIAGSGCGPTEALHATFGRFAEKGPRGMRPSSIPSCMANTMAAALSIEYGLTGTNYTVVSACTSSTNAIGIGFRMIRDGHAEAVLCVGADSSFPPFYYAMWNNLGVLSAIAESGRALRPFDTGRAGTLLGEGGGALVLESFASARRRGATIRGEVAGYGESSDATHLTGPSVAGQARAIRRALASARVSPVDIGYINAHGTGTEANDATEAQAVRDALGADCDRIPVGAMKSFFGHTLGASGIIEAIGTLLALEHRLAPRNLNLDQPDPACAVQLIGPGPCPLDRSLALKNSFGFGGGNAVLVLRRDS